MKPPGLDFDAAAFREGIVLAMSLGIPPGSEHAPTFVFPDVVETPADPLVRTLNPKARPTRIPGRRVRTTCAVEYQDSNGVVIDAGVVQPTRAVLTVLDAQHPEIKGFEYVLLGGDRFNYQRTEVLALADVTVYQVHVRARDDA